MACLNIQEGEFTEAGFWDRADEGRIGSVTIRRSSANLAISNGITNKTFFIDSRFMTVDSKFLFILYKKSEATGITRAVSVVDINSRNLDTREVVSLYSGPSTTADPKIQISAGNKNAFMVEIFGNDRRLVGFFRSDTGAPLARIPFNTVSTTGSAQVSSGNFEYSLGGPFRIAGPIPSGTCSVSPTTRSFPDVVIDADISGLDTSTATFAVENTGDDCLTINSINSVAPFTVQSTDPALPVTLDPRGSLTVVVEFAPSSIDRFQEDLTINPTPVNGDTFLRCSGEARGAVSSIIFSGSASFGTAPLGSTRTQTVAIQNNGEKNVVLNIEASTASDAPFSWPAFRNPISPSSSHALNINFIPSAEGNASGVINFTGDDPDSPHRINLSGNGCVPRAEMQVQVPNPMDPYVDFGDVQQGFRTVRVVKVTNPGNGPLNFKARIDGTDASLFGIQKDGVSILSPTTTESFTVVPTTACGGGTGAGEISFGVVFFANETPPKTAQAQLVIYDHNATNISGEVTNNLQAEITAPISVDVSLVMDRSGSMNEDSGERTKINTAIDAGKLLVELMRPDVDDRLGIVRFNNVPEVVSSITPVTASSAASLSAAINSVNFNPNNGTSIAGGVRVAIKDIDDNPRATTLDSLNTAIVVLTDGFDNVPYADPNGTTYSLLGEEPDTVPLPTPSDKKVYAVGIGDTIDTGRLSTLSQETGGQYLPIKNFSGNDYFALEKHFTQIFMDAVDLSMIYDPVFTIQPNDEHIIPIDVLGGDTELMIVVYDREGIRIPFYLETPNGEIIQLTSIPTGFQIRPGITPTARFMEVKFPIGETHRYSGQWKFIAQHDGRACSYIPKSVKPNAAEDNDFNIEDFDAGFQPRKCKNNYNEPIMYGVAVGVGSDFRMFPYVEPGIKKVGESINMNAIVSEFGLPVLHSEVTVKVESPSGTVYNYTLLDYGNHADDEANDGNYGKVFTQTLEKGHYTFYFRAKGLSRDGQPFIREAVRSKYIEGNEPLIPTKFPTPTVTSKDCCERITYFLIIIIVLILVLIIIMLRS